jgi:hypothetical protein
MPKRLDTLPYLDALRNLTEQLELGSRSDKRVQSFLDEFLQALREQWPLITRAEVYLRQRDGMLQRQAGVGGSPEAPLTPAYDAPATHALARRDLVPFEPGSGMAGWAVPLTGQNVVLGVLEVELPARAATPDSFEKALRTLAAALGPAIEHLQADMQQNKELLEQTTGALNSAFETTRQRMSYEGALNKITGHLQQQTDLHVLLQQTMQDLGQALGARRARVRLQVTPLGSEKAHAPKTEP